MTEEERIYYIYNDEEHMKLQFLLMNLSDSLLSSCPMESIPKYIKLISEIKELTNKIYTDPSFFNNEVKKQLYDNWFELLDLERSRNLVLRLKSSIDSLITWAMELQKTNIPVEKVKKIK